MSSLPGHQFLNLRQSQSDVSADLLRCLTVTKKSFAYEDMTPKGFLDKMLMTRVDHKSHIVVTSSGRLGVVASSYRTSWAVRLTIYRSISRPFLDP